MGTMPLVVAGAAALALVAIVGVDLSMNRTYALDIWNGASWREIARHPYLFSEAPEFRGQTTVEVNRSDDVRFRVRLDNGYFSAVSTGYRVTHDGGPEIAGDAISAGAREEATSEFGLPAARFFGNASSPVEPKVDERASTAYPSIQVQFDDGPFLYANFGLREASG